MPKILIAVVITLVAATLAISMAKEPLDCTPVSNKERLRIGGLAAAAPEIGDPLLKALLENDAACRRQANLQRQADLQRRVELQKQAELQRTKPQQLHALIMKIPSLIKRKCSPQEYKEIKSRIGWQYEIVCGTHIGNLSSAIKATDLASAQERFEPAFMWEESQFNNQQAIVRRFHFNQYETLFVIIIENEDNTSDMLFIAGVDQSLEPVTSSIPKK